MTLDFAAARENMVENQVRANDVTDHVVQDAMGAVQRERVVPLTKAHLAYAEVEVEYAPGLHLLQPRDVAKLMQAIRPRAGERALCIAGPYAALALKAIGLEVRLRLPAGAAGLDRVIAAAQADGVVLEQADLTAIDTAAPFDVILVEGAVTVVPETWSAMLATGGRLGVIERTGPVGRARLVFRGADDLVAGRTLFDSAPPWLPGFQPVPAFSF